jgi:hypothetical protein
VTSILQALHLTTTLHIPSRDLAAEISGLTEDTGVLRGLGQESGRESELPGGWLGFVQRSGAFFPHFPANQRRGSLPLTFFHLSLLSELFGCFKPLCWSSIMESAVCVQAP